MLDTYRMFTQLRETMDERAAETLTGLLSSIYEELQQTVTRADLAQVTTVVDRLGAAQERVAATVQALAEAQERTEARLETLTVRVDELAEAQKRTEARLQELAVRVDELAEAQKQTEARVEELVEAQKRTEARLETLTVRVDELAEAQKRTEARLQELAVRVDELAEAQKRTETRVADLAKVVHDHGNRLGRLEGRTFESQLREKSDAYFGKLLRRPRVCRVSDFLPQLESRLTEEELDDLLLVDLLMSGRLKGASSDRDVYLAVEASQTVDDHDLDRARRRADLLSKAGLRSGPVVAGVECHPALIERAKQSGIAVLVEYDLHNGAECLGRM